MRGVLTLAGEGTRMLPWSRGLRKEFLPLYDSGTNGHSVLKPVAHMVLESLVAAGIREVTLVAQPKDIDQVHQYFTVDRNLMDRHAHHQERLEETRAFYDTLSHLRLHYAVQTVPRGFGDAVLHAEMSVGEHPFLLHAADAVLLEKSRGHLIKAVADLRERNDFDAVLLVRKVADPTRYGVVEGRVEGTDAGLSRMKVTRMEEKPKKPRSKWAATAIYAFSPRIFDALRTVARVDQPRELELTDAIRRMIADGREVAALQLPSRQGEWRSVGSPDGYLRALARSHVFARYHGS